MENHHFQWIDPLFLWQFSIAMLVYQRVYPINIPLNHYKVPLNHHKFHDTRCSMVVFPFLISIHQTHSTTRSLRPWIPDAFYALPSDTIFFLCTVEPTVLETTVNYKTTLMYLNILVGGFKHGFYFPSYIYIYIYGINNPWH